MKYRPIGWMPSYEIPGKPELSLKDVAIHQCPRSFVTAESLFWVQEFYSIRTAADATKSSYTASLVDEDARFVEAMTLLDQERAMLERLITKESQR